MGRLEKEIDFYKDLFGKSFTLFVIVSGGTVAHFSQKGVDILTSAGTLISVFLFASTLATGYHYKMKIDQLEG